jgi:NitT/TauT family transport system permease protein
METQSQSGSALTTPQRKQRQLQTAPMAGQSFGRELAGRMLPPILAIGSVLALWWALYLIFPRLLPGPMSTFNEAIRLLSDGTFVFHMLQSLRRVFVGAAVAMIFSIAVGIYMGTVLMGERFFQPLVVLGLTIPGLMWALIAVMLFGINEIASYFAVAVTTFPMLVINIWAGVKALDRN